MLFASLGVIVLISGCASGASANQKTGTGSSTGSGTPAKSGGHTVSLPTDACSLLSLSALKAAVHDDFNPATSTTADAGGVPVVSGTQCQFDTGYGGGVTFIVFQDATQADAQSQFAHFEQFFPAAPNGRISGLGDEAYIDSQDALHARKDNIRFYIEIYDDTTLSTPADVDAADQQLAASVMPQI